MKRTKMRKRLLSLLLTATLLLALLPAAALPASAAGGDGGLFGELGLDTGKTPAGYTEGSNPYGRDTVALNPVYELFVGSDGPADAYNGDLRSWGLYGHNQDISGQWASEPTAATNSGAANKYDAYKTVAGDFTGSGKKANIMALGANTIRDFRGGDRSDAGLYMFAIVATGNGVSSQSGEGDLFALYSGAIGNHAELNVDKTLNYDADMDRDNDAKGYYYNANLLQNYMQIVAGDFTGDGVDEIAVYIPDPATPRIEVYQLHANTNWWEKASWKLLHSYPLSLGSGILPNKVSLAAADLNYDGIDDLAVAYGAADYGRQGDQRDTYYNNAGEAVGTVDGKVQVLFANGSGGFHTAVNVPYSSPAEAGKRLTNFSLAIGDLTGKGRDRLIVAETYEIGTTGGSGGNNYQLTGKVNIQSFSCNPDYNSFASDGLSVGSEAAAVSSRNNGVYASVRPDAAAVRPGVGQPDWLYYRGYLYQADASGALGRGQTSVYEQHAATLATGDLTPNVTGDGGNYGDYSAFFEYGVTAADVDNDFSEELVLTYNNLVTNNDGPRAYPARGLVLSLASADFGEDDKSALSVTRVFKAEMTQAQADANLPDGHPYETLFAGTAINNYALKFHNQRALILMAPADTDSDTMLLEFKEQKLTYTDPEVLAVIAGAPLYKDLEHVDDPDGYIGESGTTWATSTGSGTGSTRSHQFEAGLYLGYEHDVTVFGAPIFSIDMQFEYTHAITWETEKISTVTETVEYGAVSYKDAVALYSVPVAVYVYTARIPTGNSGESGYETQEFTVNIPFSPAVTVLEVDAYERVAAGYEGFLPSLRGAGGETAALTHTQGRPETYPSSSAGFQKVRAYTGNFAHVGYGNTEQTQKITIENEETSSTTHNDEFSFSLGGGAGGVKAGVTLGYELGYGSAKIKTNGSEFSGTVRSMPEAARGYGYDYSWKIMQYWHTFSDGSEVPVVSYIVETGASGASGPLAAPQDPIVDVERSTEDSLTLNWAYETGLGVSAFQVYRYDPQTGSYDRIGATVPYDPAVDSYSYTDAGLSRGTQYSYKVQALRAGGVGSVLSAAASGWTLANTEVRLALSTYDLTAYPDKSYTVTSALSAGDSAATPTYVWEKHDGSRWADTAFHGADLTFSSIRPTQAGRYRLRASLVVDGLATVVYSPVLTVTAAKRAANMTVTVSESGNDLVLTATLKNPAGLSASGAIPDGTVSFAVSCDGAPAITYTEALGGFSYSQASSTATVIIENAADGAYIVDAVYSGSAVFHSARQETLYHLKGAASSYIYATAPETMYYGDEVHPRFFLIEGNDATPTDITHSTGYAVWLTGIRTSGGQDALALGHFQTIGPKGYRAANRYDGYYEATFKVRPGGVGTVDPSGQQDLPGDVNLTHRFTVLPRPLTVAANVGGGSGSISQENITAFTAADLDIRSGSLAPGDNLLELVTARVTDEQGGVVFWNAQLPQGNYTVTPRYFDPFNYPANYVKAVFCYDMTFIAQSVSVTGSAYAVSVSAGENGTAALTSHTGSEFAFGVPLTFTATPDMGYTVDTWTATANGQTVKTQTGGTSFTVNTPAAAMAVHVSFKAKDIYLSWEAVEAGDGTISVTDDGAGITDGAQVQEGSALVLTAAPVAGKQFHSWLLYVGGGGVPLQHTANPLEIKMPGESVHALALFEAARHRVTFSDNIRVTYTDGGQEIPVHSGDLVPHGTVLDIRPKENDNSLITGIACSTGTATEKESFPSLWQYTVTDEAALSATVVVRYFLVKPAAHHGVPSAQTEVAAASIDVFVNGSPVTFSDTSALFQKGDSVRLVLRDVPAEYVPGYWRLNNKTIYDEANRGEVAFTLDTDYLGVYHILAESAPAADPTLTFTDAACVDGEGGTVASGDPVAPGTELTFTFSGGPGLRLLGWNVAATDFINSSIGGQQGDSATFRFTMPAFPITVTPASAEKTVAVTVENSTGGAYQLDCGQGIRPDAVPVNSELTLTVTPDAHHSPIVAATGATVGAPAVSGGTYTYKIRLGDADATIRITYQSELEYLVTLDRVGLFGGTISASHTTAKAGTEVTLTAVADSGYAHNGWEVWQADGQTPVPVSGNTFLMPASNVTVRSLFVASSPGGGGTVIVGGGGGGGEVSVVGDILVSSQTGAVRLASGEPDSLDAPGGALTVLATLGEDAAGRRTLALEVSAGGRPVSRVAGGLRVSFYYEGGGANTVAVLQNGGEGAVLPKSYALNGQMVVRLDGPATLVILDNPRDFPDTLGHWGREGVDFVTSHELFNGVAAGVFSADGTMTRAMLWTVLARLEGVDASGGSPWYETGRRWAVDAGVSDGSDPQASVTREQLAVMLWRVAGSPAPVGGLEGFRDAASASPYAVEALRWVIQEGVVNGKGGGVLDPGGNATRAEVAAMLMRFIRRL